LPHRHTSPKLACQYDAPGGHRSRHALPVRRLRVLRQGGRPESSFVQRWVSRLIYYDLPERIFTVIYVVFGLIVALTFIYIRPDRRANQTGQTGRSGPAS
jgi:hypothetical protein